MSHRGKKYFFGEVIILPSNNNTCWKRDATRPLARTGKPCYSAIKPVAGDIAMFTSAIKPVAGDIPLYMKTTEPFLVMMGVGLDTCARPPLTCQWQRFRTRCVLPFFLRAALCACTGQ